MYDHHEFEAVLRARGVPHACPSCGSTGDRAGTARPVALIETGADGLIELDRMSRMVIATFCGTRICQNCGFVSLHALAPLGLEQSVLPHPELN